MNNTRKLRITRKKQHYASGIPYQVFIGGRDCGKIDNNHDSASNMDFNEHTIQFRARFADGEVRSELIRIPANFSNYYVFTYSKMGLLAVIYLLKYLHISYVIWH